MPQPRPRRHTMADALNDIDRSDLEARLRAGLADLAATAPDPASRGVDLDAPLRTHRHRFERRRRFLAGAVVTTAAAGIGAAVVLSRPDEPELRTGTGPDTAAVSPSRWKPIDTT